MKIVGRMVPGGVVPGGTVLGGTVLGGMVTGGTASGNLVPGEAASGNLVSGVTVSGGVVPGRAASGNLVSGGTVSGVTVSGGTVSGNLVSGNPVSGGTVSGGVVPGNLVMIKKAVFTEKGTPPINGSRIKILRRIKMNTMNTMNTALTNDQLVASAPSVGALSPIAGVSDRYTFIPTLDVVDLMRDVGWFPISVNESRTISPGHAGYQRHSIRFSHEGTALNLGRERLDILLVNSHNRGSAFKLIASLWRMICGNGLMVASKFANFSHKHVGFSQNDFVQSAQAIAGSAGEISNRIDDMKAIEMSPDERGIFAQAAHGLVYDEPENAPIAPERLLQERRYDDAGKDLWTTYNVIQENVIKGGIKGVNPDTTKRTRRGYLRKQTTRPVKAIDRDIKLNKALWTMTEKMVELKTGNA